MSDKPKLPTAADVLDLAFSIVWSRRATFAVLFGLVLLTIWSLGSLTLESAFLVFLLIFIQEFGYALGVVRGIAMGVSSCLESTTDLQNKKR